VVARGFRHGDAIVNEFCYRFTNIYYQYLRMGRSRYQVVDARSPHFFTCTVVEWQPVFVRPQCVQIVLDSWRYLREHEEFRLYGFVIMENHVHGIAQAEDMASCLRRFKSFTARRIVDELLLAAASDVLARLHWGKVDHKTDRAFQFWQEGSHAEIVTSEEVMRQKLDYIHLNPVRRGYVDQPEHWRYSSARNYAGQVGVIEIDHWM
jgi:putative transposase